MSPPGSTRRDFLRSLPGALIVVSCGGGEGGSTGEAPDVPGVSDPEDVLRAFPQGLAAGDPRPESVLLWTRAQPSAGEEERAIELRVRVTLDEAGERLVHEGVLEATPESDHTARVKLTTLSPATTYYYRFGREDSGVWSDTGRTRTAPAEDSELPLRFAIASCQEYVGRWFHAWRALAELEEREGPVDFVLFLGDYIYESIADPRFQELGSERALELPDGLPLDGLPDSENLVAYTLADYRALYRQYRADPDLRRAHARYPFVIAWDDHEFTNDAWQDVANEFDGAQGEERQTARREAATRAWFEYLPVDVPRDAAASFPDDIVTYRGFRYGRHVELLLSDVRYYRDDHVVPEGPAVPEVGKIIENSPLGARVLAIKEGFDALEAEARPTMLGAAQKQWLLDAARASETTWTIWGSALMAAQMVIDLSAFSELPLFLQNRFYFKPDQWDGFRSERAEILAALAERTNVVVLSGDLHGFYAAELRPDFDDPAAPATAVEFTVSGISSIPLAAQLDKFTREDPALAALGLEELVPLFDDNLREASPHIVHADSARYGFAIVEADADALTVDFHELDEVRTRAYVAPARVTSFRVRAGSRTIERV